MKESLHWLRRILVHHLNDPDKIKSLVTSFNIPEEDIDWDQPLAYLWHTVLHVTDREGKLNRLFKDILSDKELEAKLRPDIEKKGLMTDILSRMNPDFHKIGVLDTINCGRSIEADDFVAHVDLRNGEEKLYTALISGPQEGCPTSLAARIIMQLMGKIRNEEQAGFYPRNPRNGRIQELTLKTDNQIMIHNTLDRYFEVYLESQDLSSYKLIAFLIDVPIDNPKTVTRIFDMVHKQFEQLQKDTGISIILTVAVTHSHDFDTTTLQSELTGITKSTELVKYYPIGRTVSRKEISNWYRNLVTQNEESLAEQMNMLLGLIADNQQSGASDNKSELSMETVEKMQKLIFQSTMQSSTDKTIEI